MSLTNPSPTEVRTEHAVRHAGPPCRLCAAPLHTVFVDLGATPLANANLRPEQLSQMEPYYPLRVFVCERCLLAQLEAVVTPDAIFNHYPYFSSFSDTLLRQSQDFASAATRSLDLQPGDRVVEIASNDGYLLQYFLQQGMDVLGIDAAANVAAAAMGLGIPTRVAFFGRDVARDLVRSGIRARLVIANNVLAHVPDLHDFVGGLALLVEHGGVATLEFHHLLSLVAHRQFDNIYHEHFQYFSLGTARRTLAAHGLRVFDVEELDAQGGSLRLFACRHDDPSRAESRRVDAMLAKEEAAGLNRMDTYRAFGARLVEAKLELLAFLVSARQSGRSVVCYGAAAKGNTLLNYCGVHADLVDFAVDRNPHKQGGFLPGSRIPIYHPDRVRDTRPDYVLVLPWNLQDEITQQLSYIRDWGGRFVVPIPTLRVIP